jgi:hypothetical protein
LSDLATVGVPKTAVDLDGDLTAGQDNVWRPREIFSMESEPVTEAMKETAHDHLGRGVLCADAGHQGAAGFDVSVIDHAVRTMWISDGFRA